MYVSHQALCVAAARKHNKSFPSKFDMPRLARHIPDWLPLSSWRLAATERGASEACWLCAGRSHSLEASHKTYPIQEVKHHPASVDLELIKRLAITIAMSE